jgi:hypothetical protein
MVANIDFPAKVLGAYSGSCAEYGAIPYPAFQ